MFRDQFISYANLMGGGGGGRYLPVCPEWAKIQEVREVTGYTFREINKQHGEEAETEKRISEAKNK